MKKTTNIICAGLAAVAFACFALPQKAQAVSPPPDGGYPGGNTAEGQNALLSRTSGVYNAAIGWLSLEGLTTGIANTGVGAGALALNNGDRNTATGAGALLFNSTGGDNTAYGAFALFNNTVAQNCAFGSQALFSNTTGNNNTASGYQALFNNTTGSHNTCLGSGAGLGITVGSNNVILGDGAGTNIHTTDGNIYIGAGVNPPNTAFESNTLRINDSSAPASGSTSTVFIGGITGANVSAAGTSVVVNASGQLGTVLSSARFKRDVESMGESSEAIFSLRPVSFHYKDDESNLPCFGLIAEEVAKANRNLILLDKEGKPLTVRYEQINAMLLNEFLKEHRKVQQQQATLTQLSKAMDVLTMQVRGQAAQIQKVSAQVELPRAARQTVAGKN